MSTAFLCGEMRPAAFELIRLWEYNAMIKSIVKKYNIDTVYITKRNDFDLEFYVSLVEERMADQVKIINLVDSNNYEIEYNKTLYNGISFKRFCPFNEGIENRCLYRTLYNYAIENSDYMITYLKYDDDISCYVAEEAEKKGVEIINIADMFERFVHLTTEPSDELA